MASEDVPSAQPERRAAQRFAMSVPVAVQCPEGSFPQETALSHDVSTKGIFFLMNARPREGSSIEFTVNLPSEVTLTDPMRVSCKGRVIRVVGEESTHRIGVGATIEGYNSFIRLSRLDTNVVRMV
ncbi:MAG TPA: PilZ domain-containing protein [Terriglobales bacterium]|nr:PilZ domain-containing protein [Terriglobales bacterium]